MIWEAAFLLETALFLGFCERCETDSQAVRQGEMGMAPKAILSLKRGFTLIEISMVLVVIGLLLSGGLVALAPVIGGAKRTQTENTLTKIEYALLLYASQNNCLPCPADATAPTTEGRQANAAGTPVAAACAGTVTACFTGPDAVVV